jgi:hypothetical protein
MEDRTPRFITEQVLVTGHTPAELETEAIAHAAMLTGWDAGRLAVQTPYQVFSTIDAEARNARALTTDQIVPLTADQQTAIAAGDQLYAHISVCAYGPPPTGTSETGGST